LLAALVIRERSVRPPEFLKPRLNISHGFYLYAFALFNRWLFHI
jgi:hypothetical protein